jgi:uncharacterized protein YukE
LEVTVARQVSAAQFNVLMGEFHDAINVVSTQSNNVHETVAGIEQNLNSVTDLWSSPAAMTFDPLRAEFRRSADDLDDVLTGILHRMRITYGNYLDAERKAQQNLTANRVQSHAVVPHSGSPITAQSAPHKADNSKHGALPAQDRAALASEQQTLPFEGHPVLPLAQEARSLPATDVNGS